jgi:pimeloyl-ACP methyl ester carboxylesterase
MNTTQPVTAPPSLLLLALEGRALGELGGYYVSRPLLGRLPRGDGHPVLVLPGLGASDRSTRPLRAFLKGRGYAPYGWGLGRNVGRRGAGEYMVHTVRELQRGHGRKVSLVGWSMGGIYAREVARQVPDLVRLVITLGSPFAGSARASNAWRAYELLSGDRATDGPQRTRLRPPPPVPCTSIYSRSDGIVAWQGCLEQPGPHTENIEVVSSHFGLGVNPLALAAIADRLAQPEGQWAPFARSGLRRMLYPRPAVAEAST